MDVILIGEFNSVMVTLDEDRSKEEILRLFGLDSTDIFAFSKLDDDEGEGKIKVEMIFVSKSKAARFVRDKEDQFQITP